MEKFDRESVSKVNLDAQKSRHRRLMQENPSIWVKKIKKAFVILFALINPVHLFKIATLKSEHIRFLHNFIRDTHVAFANLPCEKRFTKRITSLALALFVLSSINIYSIGLSDVYAFGSDVGADFLLISDDEGYLTKSMPTGERLYASRVEVITHKVESGETVSGIAYMYGLKTSTILDNNQLGSANYLKMGQEIVILPVDGYLYSVKKGDTLSAIAKNMKISEEKIKEFNPMLADAIKVGQKLLLEGVRSPQSQTRYIASGSGAILGSSYVSSAPNNEGFVTPTPVNGRYSRGFTSGHPALDIARKDKSYQPNVVSPINGTVVAVRQIGWNGGYGSHLVLERSDGVQVLMAHFEANKIYVSEGDSVVAGQIVGMMGTTGRSSGVHLHVEVIVNGIKRNPLNYFSL